MLLLGIGILSLNLLTHMWLVTELVHLILAEDLRSQTTFTYEKYAIYHSIVGLINQN